MRQVSIHDPLHASLVHKASGTPCQINSHQLLAIPHQYCSSLEIQHPYIASYTANFKYGQSWQIFQTIWLVNQKNIFKSIRLTFRASSVVSKFLNLVNTVSTQKVQQLISIKISFLAQVNCSLRCQMSSHTMLPPLLTLPRSLEDCPQTGCPWRVCRVTVISGRLSRRGHVLSTGPRFVLLVWAPRPPRLSRLRVMTSCWMLHTHNLWPAATGARATGHRSVAQGSLTGSVGADRRHVTSSTPVRAAPSSQVQVWTATNLREQSSRGPSPLSLN